MDLEGWALYVFMLVVFVMGLVVGVFIGIDSVDTEPLYRLNVSIDTPMPPVQGCTVWQLDIIDNVSQWQCKQYAIPEE
jgi:hypothetical protein